MATVENKSVDVMDALDMLYDDTYETPKQEMTSEELQSLDTIHVKWAPDGAEYIGSYFAPYHDVNVYRGTDGKYYSVWFSIGD